VVFQGDDAPDATHQQLFELAHIGIGNLGVFDAQVRQQGFVHVALFIEFDGDFVDNLVSSALAHLGFDLLRFIRAHIIFSQDALDVDQAALDDGFVITGAVHAQQVLQHVHRDVGTLFNQLGQVFAHHLAGKVGVEQGVQAALCQVFGLRFSACHGLHHFLKVIAEGQVHLDGQAQHFNIGHRIAHHQVVAFVRVMRTGQHGQHD